MLGTSPADLRQVESSVETSTVTTTPVGNARHHSSHPGSPSRRARRWWWTLPISLVVLLPHVLRAGMSDADWSRDASGIILRLSAALLALGAGCVLGCHWWITHNRGSAWLSAVALAIAVDAVPFALVGLNSPETLNSPTTMLDNLVHWPFVVLLLVGSGHRTFRRRVDPILLGLSVGLICVLARSLIAMTDLESAGVVPHVTAWSGRILAAALGILAVAAIARMTALPRWARAEVIVAATGVALAEVVAPDDMDNGFAGVIGGGIAVAAFMLLAVTAAELLLEGIRESERRLLLLAERAHSAEQTVQDDQEVLHEVRGSVAGISSASRILTQLNQTVEESKRKQLVEMLGAELDRLEHLLCPQPDKAPEVVPVDPVIVPLVSTYQHLGLDVEWQPSGATAYTRREDLATILHVLLSNAARHAPGSSTTIRAETRDGQTVLRVEDDGPGVPDPMRPRLFDRGVRSNKSDGQGLGLFIAKKLACENGGRIELDDHPGQGATFVVRLPAREPVS